MTKFLNIAAWLLALCFAGNTTAQTLSAADQKGVEASYLAFQSAFDQMDAITANPLFVPNAVVIDPTGEIVRGRDNLMTYFTNLFAFFKTLPKPDRRERKNQNWESRYLAPDLVLSTYTEETVEYFGDKSKNGKTAFAILLRKSGKQWLIELVTLTPVQDMPVEK